MDVLNFNITDYLKYVLALVFVLSLIGIFAVIARRAGFGLSNSVHGKRQRRLGIIETLNIDGKRKLLLIKRDTVEHLILLGADGDLLIESAVTPPKNAFTQALHEAAHVTRTADPIEPRFDIPTPPTQSEPSLDLPSGLQGPISDTGKNRGPESGS